MKINNDTLTSKELTQGSILPLSDLGVLCVAGPDAKKFLQGQLTCNLENISATHTQIGAHCNPQGRIIHLFRLFYYQECYYLQMPISMIPLALTALKKYAIFFKVTLSDASDLLASIGYCGDQLQNYLVNIPQKIDELTESNDVLIIKLAGRYEIIASPTALALVWKKLIADNYSVSTEIWQHLNFKENIPTIYPETSEKFLPHDIQLHQLNAISFDKGCYTGQEIIARMHYRAKIKNKLWHVTVKTECTPQRGADIYDSINVVGMLVDYYKISYNTYALQIMAPHENGLFLNPNQHDPLQR